MNSARNTVCTRLFILFGAFAAVLPPFTQLTQTHRHRAAAAAVEPQLCCFCCCCCQHDQIAFVVVLAFYIGFRQFLDVFVSIQFCVCARMFVVPNRAATDAVEIVSMYLVCACLCSRQLNLVKFIRVHNTNSGHSDSLHFLYFFCIIRMILEMFIFGKFFSSLTFLSFSVRNVQILRLTMLFIKYHAFATSSYIKSHIQQK